MNFSLPYIIYEMALNCRFSKRARGRGGVCKWVAVEILTGCTALCLFWLLESRFQSYLGGFCGMWGRASLSLFSLSLVLQKFMSKGHNVTPNKDNRFEARIALEWRGRSAPWFSFCPSVPITTWWGSAWKILSLPEAFTEDHPSLISGTMTTLFSRDG